MHDPAFSGTKCLIINDLQIAQYSVNLITKQQMTSAGEMVENGGYKAKKKGFRLTAQGAGHRADAGKGRV